KMRYPGPPDFLGEMPIAIRTILFQFVYAMMPGYVLQIRHGNFEFSALCHRVNEIIQQRLLVEITKQARRFLPPRLRLRPCSEGESVPPASEGPGRKIRASTPIKLGIKAPQLLRVKIKMRQPGWNFLSICRDRNLAPENLKIDVGADLWSKVSPDNCVRIKPNVKLKRPLPHRCQFSAAAPTNQVAHCPRGQF